MGEKYANRRSQNIVSKAPGPISNGLPGDVIVRFLKSPPDGTPAEVIEAFSMFSSDSGAPLSPRLFFEIVEQAPVAVSITGSDAKILYANRAFETLTGFRREDVVGKNESILSNKATPGHVYQDMWKTISGKKTWKGTLVNRRKNGASYLAEVVISPVLGAGQEVTHFLGMHRDVTEVHRLQQELRHQKGLVESVIDAAPIVVALIGDDAKVLLDNHEYKKLVSDFRTREPAGLLLKALEEQAEMAFDTLKAKGRSFQNVEVRLDFAGHGATRWFACSGVWIARPDSGVSSYFREARKRRSALLLLANDITHQRREFERARIQHLSATLAEQQRIFGMREALAAAIFQVQQPLNLANAAVAVIRRNHATGDNLLTVLEQIAESAHQAFESLKTALPAEMREPRGPVNLNEIIQEVLDLSTESLLTEGIVVEWRPAAVLPTLVGQRKQLRGLFKNLVDNAVDSLSELRRPDKEIRVSTAERNRALVVEIQDNGLGIPKEQRLTVFEPLYSAWRSRRGHAGMGLAIAQEIANEHRGTIEIDREVVGGCLVRVILPESD